MSILLINGIIVTDEITYTSEIGIEGEKIVEIGKNLDRGSYDVIIDVEEHYIMPGFIDPHVHVQLPMRGMTSHDDGISATRAAAAGGVTTIIDFATQMGNESLLHVIKERRETVFNETYIDYGMHGGITNWEVVRKELREILDLGITSFKMFMAYKERGLYSSNEDILDALIKTKDHGLIMLHAESEELLTQSLEKYDTPERKKELGILAHVRSRPPETEYLAIEEAIELAKRSNGHVYIVHISTRRGAEYVRLGREEGINITGETCPQYLVFDETVFYKVNSHYYATAPQIKTEDDMIGLWKELQSGGVQVIGTDSVVFTTAEKNKWNGDFTKVPLGVHSTELLASIIFTEGVMRERISINQFVGLLSTKAAKVFGLYPRKGVIAVGSDADITIFNPEIERVIDQNDLLTNTDWTPYQNMRLKGMPVKTFLRGKLIASDGKCTLAENDGIYLRRDRSLTL